MRYPVRKPAGSPYMHRNNNPRKEISQVQKCGWTSALDTELLPGPDSWPCQPHNGQRKKTAFPLTALAYAQTLLLVYHNPVETRLPHPQDHIAGRGRGTCLWGILLTGFSKARVCSTGLTSHQAPCGLFSSDQEKKGIPSLSAKGIFPIPESGFKNSHG